MGQGIARRARWVEDGTLRLLAARPVRFLVVGGICFTSVVLLFEALRRVLPLSLAATLAYAVGATASYELNRSWTFGLRERSWGQGLRFATITAAAMAANAVLLPAIVATFDVREVAGEVLSLACIAPLTFVAYRVWGFRPDDAGLLLGSGAAAGHAGAGGE